MPEVRSEALVLRLKPSERRLLDDAADVLDERVSTMARDWLIIRAARVVAKGGSK